MCLQYKPTVVACVCIHLVCKWYSFEVSRCLLVTWSLAADVMHYSPDPTEPRGQRVVLVRRQDGDSRTARRADRRVLGDLRQVPVEAEEAHADARLPRKERVIREQQIVRARRCSPSQTGRF